MTPDQFEFIKYAILALVVLQMLGMLILVFGIDNLKKSIDDLGNETEKLNMMLNVIMNSKSTHKPVQSYNRRYPGEH